MAKFRFALGLATQVKPVSGWLFSFGLSSMKLFSPFSMLGLSACLLPALVVGCGGGGGGPSAPRATATPVVQPLPTTSPTAATGAPTPVPVTDACNPNNYTPNYASSVDSLLRWPGFPLRIFLESTNARTRDLTLRGFDQWVNAGGNRVSYTVVNSANNADITVKFAQFADGDGDTLGVTTTYFFQGQKTIQRAEIQFYYFPFDSRADAEATNQSVAAHEFGHALGIGGHSSVNVDLMFASISGGSKAVTTRDFNTLRTSYCDNFPARSNAVRQQQGVLDSFTISLKRSGCQHDKH